MSSLLFEIANNDISSLDIHQEAEDAFASPDGDVVFDFLHALKQNTSITQIRLTDDFLCCLRADARSKVIRALADDLGSSLTDIVLGDTLMQVVDLTYIVTMSTPLRSLALHNVVLQGAEAQFRALENALLQHASLKEFDMSDSCESAIKEIDLTRLLTIKKAAARAEVSSASIQNSAIAMSA